MQNMTDLEGPVVQSADSEAVSRNTARFTPAHESQLVDQSGNNSPLLKHSEVPKLLDDVEIDDTFTDYLVHHGALSANAGDAIISEISPSSKIKALLQALQLSSEREQAVETSNNPEATGKISRANLLLLVNALRQTGQHLLASKLDVERRITPAPWASIATKYNLTFEGASDATTSSSGDLISLRLRGQLNLWIQLSAIKINPVSYEHLLATPTTKFRCGLSGTSTFRGSVNAPAHVNRIKRGSLDIEKTVYIKPRVTPMTPEISRLRNHFLSSQRIVYKPHGASFWIDLEPERRHSVLRDKSIDNVHLVVSLPDSIPDKQDVPPPASPVFSVGNVDCLKVKTHKSKHRFSFLVCLLCFRKRRRKFSNAFLSEEYARTPDSQLSRLHDYRLPSSVQPLQPNSDTSYSNGVLQSPVDNHAAEEEEVRRTKLIVLDTKSSEFYDGLLDPASSLHDALVKYLEQSAGVLVLGCRMDSGFPDIELSANPTPAPAVCVRIVATTTDALKRLATITVAASNTSVNESTIQKSDDSPKACMHTRLSRDLETAFVVAGCLNQLDIQGLRLAVGVDDSEVKRAKEEISE